MIVVIKGATSVCVMAKPKKRAKRGKKHNKKYKWESAMHDTVRTCVSGDKLERSCPLSPLHLAEILSNVSTPSPKLHVSASDTKLLDVPQMPFRRRSRSSLARLNTSRLDFEIDDFQKSPNIKQNGNIQTNNLKTPTRKVRNSSLVNTEDPKVNIEQENNNNVEELSFFTPELFSKYSTPNPKINSMQKSSTPKIRSRKISLNIDDDTENVFDVEKSVMTPKKLKSMRSLSPILNSSNVKTQKNGTKTSPSISRNSIFIGNTAGMFTKFRKINSRWPIIVADIYTWIGIALKKSFAILKQYCYTMIIQQTTNKECCLCHQNEAKLTILHAKYEEQAAELVRLKSELESCKEMWREFHEFKQQVLSTNAKVATANSAPALGLPPPPPPPPPPPMMPLFPVINQLIIPGKKKDLKQVNTTNNRPVITVDQLMKVQLRKITARTPLQRKPSPGPKEELFKKMRLRQTTHSQTPQNLGNSPKSCLARILKTSDTNVRTVRRIKAQFLSYDDISRQNSFRFRTNGNDSAPVV